MPRKNNDQVSLYCEETNAGLVMRIYRIVPQMHSAVLPLFICVKKQQLKYYLESTSLVYRMRGKHLPVGVEIFEQTYGLILFG